ncbi:uncharacterized protein LOC132700919 [Cylas formicarius]|uniref:uncharacterized protein LOC132700919 n=1 Tax=Cylas formicarius TaxID=197179 RepID=UPI002958BC84|nr:uncharacterized protein LOC132700919 [Cylas formicarius]
MSREKIFTWNMFSSKLNIATLFTITVILYADVVVSRNIPEGFFHSEAIVTKWPTTPKTEVSDGKEENSPGWVRKQLLKFGQVASRMGNALGKHATKMSSTIEKICEVIKTFLPLLAAVCHVGQFAFCAAADEVPSRFSDAVSSMDLSELDR